MMHNRLGWLGLVMVAAMPVLGGCAAAVVGGTAVGVLVAADRRTVGTVTEDKIIETKIKTFGKFLCPWKSSAL